MVIKNLPRASAVSDRWGTFVSRGAGYGELMDYRTAGYGPKAMTKI
jgi:hypothetical protein